MGNSGIKRHKKKKNRRALTRPRVTKKSAAERNKLVLQKLADGLRESASAIDDEAVIEKFMRDYDAGEMIAVSAKRRYRDLIAVRTSSLDLGDRGQIRSVVTARADGQWHVWLEMAEQAAAAKDIEAAEKYMKLAKGFLGIISDVQQLTKESPDRDLSDAEARRVALREIGRNAREFSDDELRALEDQVIKERARRIDATDDRRSHSGDPIDLDDVVGR